MTQGARGKDRTEGADMPAPGTVRPRAPLRVLGTSVTQTAVLKRAAEEDLGIALEFITRDGTEAQRQGALQPASFDVYDQWFHDIDLIWPTGSICPIDVDRIARWDEINDLPKTGRLRPDLPRPQGGDPSKRLFVQLDGTLGDTVSNRVSMVPTVHNADSFAVTGVDPASVESWGALLDPNWAGRVVLQADAAIGTLDMMLALQARGELTGASLGDLSLEEIYMLAGRLSDFVQAGHFCCVWSDEAQAVAAMQRDGPRIGSMWWSGITQLRAAGIQAHMVTPKEGYRGWYGGLALSAKAEGWARDAAYDYFNFWLDGRPGAIMAQSGAYMSNPEAVRACLPGAEWDFWYGGQPATGPIRDADGTTIFDTGEAREGGSYAQRMSRVRVWDSVMTEHNYLARQWEGALTGGLPDISAIAFEGSPASPAPERPRSP
jgi:putative spermidine/putrescine transport system substrate-binding protein